MHLEYKSFLENIQNKSLDSMRIKDYYKEKRISNMERQLLGMIRLLTLKERTQSEQEYIIKTIENLNIRLFVDEMGNEYEIEFSDEHQLEPLYFQLFVLLGKENGGPLLEQLLTRERYGKCHSYVVWLGSLFEECKIVTSFISSYHNDDAIIHSYLVIGDNQVIDPSLNLIMRKIDYDRLFHVEEQTIILREQLVEDTKYFKEQQLAWIPKLYCLFPEEYMKDIKMGKSVKKITNKHKATQY